jgi:hypothetical protein
MEKRDTRKLCINLKKTATEKYEMLKNAYGEECLSRTSVLKWCKRFNAERESLQEDDRRSSSNFQNRIIDGSHSKVFVRRSNFECSEVRTNDKDQKRNSTYDISPIFEKTKKCVLISSSFVNAASKIETEMQTWAYHYRY